MDRGKPFNNNNANPSSTHVNQMQHQCSRGAIWIKANILSTHETKHKVFAPNEKNPTQAKQCLELLARHKAPLPSSDWVLYRAIT
jgi:hypothetical protein